jgi:hypothetical protein
MSNSTNRPYAKDIGPEEEELWNAVLFHQDAMTRFNLNSKTSIAFELASRDRATEAYKRKAEEASEVPSWQKEVQRFTVEEDMPAMAIQLLRDNAPDLMLHQAKRIIDIYRDTGAWCMTPNMKGKFKRYENHRRLLEELGELQQSYEAAHEKLAEYRDEVNRLLDQTIELTIANSVLRSQLNDLKPQPPY